MLMLEKALELTSPEDLDREIKERTELVTQMVGSLYPSILKGEIGKLVARRNQLSPGEKLSFSGENRSPIP